MDALSAQDLLRQLADSYGVEPGYHDDLKRWRDADPEAVLAVLRVLGASVKGLADVPGALRERRQSLWRRSIEPVLVAWDGQGANAVLRSPAREASAALECRLDFESGESRTWPSRLADLPLVERAEVEGVAYESRRLSLPSPSPLPIGWHRLTVQWKGAVCTSTVISAPTRAFGPDKTMNTWGVFLPLYALRTARDWGNGDFTDLGNLIEWVQNQGGGIVGTLPVLAAYLDEPLEPSPYSPASRLFWNELYIDPRAAAEFSAAQAVVKAPAFAADRDALRSKPLVDYKRTAALKRRVLEPMARAFFARPADRLAAFQRFTASHPRAEDYARFRAAVEKVRASWWAWPERMRDGVLEPGDYDDEAMRYHLYVQWLADEQVSALAARAGGRGPGLYLDLPLGVNPDGYDVWRDRDSFALGVSAGAPPDSFFTLGQDWGFPPLHPENLRATGYRYLRDVLKHHFQHAGVLRIDHLMGLHRFYWVPREFGAARGVYVRYPSEELYAVFSLESNRNKCALVGEDLGTVPPEVRPAMAKHNIHRLYIGQFEMKPDRNDPFTWVQGGSVASLNTHDLPTFAAFWNEADIADRLSQGLISEETARKDREYRRGLRTAVLEKLRQEGRIGHDEDPKWVLRACLTHMAQYGEPLFVLTNLEDLWLTNEPQNRPGTTWMQKPNWQTKAVHPMEEFDGLPGLRETLRDLDQAVRSRR